MGAGRIRSLSSCALAVSGRERDGYTTPYVVGGKEGRAARMREGRLRYERAHGVTGTFDGGKTRAITQTMPFTTLNGDHANHPLTSSIGVCTGSPRKLKGAVPDVIGFEKRLTTAYRSWKWRGTMGAGRMILNPFSQGSK